MYLSQTQIIAAVYIENNSLALCLFNQSEISINCTQLLHYCYLDQQIIYNILSICTQVITNLPKHYLFDKLTTQPQQFKTQLSIENIKSLFNEIIMKNFIKLKNINHYYDLMYQDSPLKFKCLGMIIYHLLNQTMILKKHKIFFQDIQYWNDYILNHVQITDSQINFLQISHQKFHPSLLIKQTPGNFYQGASILKIFDKKLRIKGSKKYLKRILFNPTYNQNQLEQRFLTIQWIQNYLIDKSTIQKFFKNIFSLDSILERFQKGRVQVQDWRKIIKSLENMCQLRRFLPNLNLPHIIKRFLDNQNWPRISKLSQLINSTLQINPLRIKDQINQELAYLRNLNLKMPQILNRITYATKWQVKCRIIFISQQGYLVQVPHQCQVPQKYLNDQNWIEEFSNASGKFYSNQVTNHLNEQYGDILARIKDIQVEILFDLQTQVSEHFDLIIQTYWNVCSIQCFYGISQICKNMAIPNLSSEQLIVINGWHILLGQSAIDNNSFSFHHQKGPQTQVFDSESNIVNTNYSNRLSIVSGPNGAGKTIYMKQLGIIFYMAHCGLFVPATLAQIPLIDRIIVAQNSYSLQGKDTGFSKQLKSLGKIMNKGIITNKSLILIDQIGLNRDYTIALKVIFHLLKPKQTLYACVKYLSKNNQNKDCFCRNRILQKSSDHFKIPISFIITHLTMLMTQKVIEQNYYIRFLMLDINNNFQYLYKIKPGLVKSGYGIKTAEGFIKDEKIIQNCYKYWIKIKNQ